MARSIAASRLLLRLAGLLAAAYVVLWGVGWLLSDQVAFRPPKVPGPLPEGVVFVEAGGGVRLATLPVVVPGAPFTILFHHGNAEDLAEVAPFLRELSEELGASVLGYDYRGFGASGGRPGETVAYEDAELLYHKLREEPGVPPSRIVVHGRSLGGAVAADLASRRPVAGLVLESTFVSASRTVVPFRLFPFDILPVRKKLARARCPTLVLHGSRDEVAPLAHARKLHRAAAGSPKELVVVEGAGHDDLAAVGGRLYFDALRRFLERLPR